MSARWSLILVLCTGVAVADDTFDWPGWRGADRTGVSQETGLLNRWPSGGPKLLWKAEDMGKGFSTPAVANGRIYLIGAKAGVEKVIALSVEDQKVAWETPIGKMAQVGYAGSRCTPTIDGGFCYAIASDGDLACLDLKNGKVRWKAHLARDFGGRYGSWAYAESPLIDGDRVIVTPGGKNSLVALGKRNGRPIWRSGPLGGREEPAAYASAIVAMVAGKKQYIQFLSGGVVGVDASSGKMLWSYTNCANGTANIPTPIYRDNHVFAASGYGTGGGLVKLDRRGANEVYFTKRMVNHHGGIVLVGDHLYGTNDSSFLCLDFKTGEIAWQERSVGKGSILCVDNKLIVRSEGGPVALVAANPAKYEELGRFRQPDRSNDPAWAHPVVANGRLYLRDQDVVLCYDVKGE